MAENSKIEWTDHTWSPWEGCTKVSPGCDHCYAEGMNRWLRKGANWGPGAPRREYSDDHWTKPLKWNAAAKAAGQRAKVFPSVCDPFDKEVPTIWRVKFFARIAATEHLTWLLLTKRIGNATRLIEDAAHEARERGMHAVATWLFGWLNGDAPDNVWLGATIVNQEEADRDIPKLLATPAQVRFLSMEPLLGPVTLPGFNSSTSWCPVCKAIVPDSLMAMHENTHGPGLIDQPFNSALHCSSVYDLVNWVIVGGESGHGARPMHPDWARSLRDQCAAAGVPLLFKQWGEFAGAEPAGLDLNACYEKSSTGGWVEPSGDYSLGEQASARDRAAAHVFRVGKKAAGRVLDGVEHNGFPEVR